MIKLLIVDDEPAICDMLKKTFSYTYETLTASDGETALKIVRGQRPDIVLLDVLMPGKNGLEVLWEIKQIDKSIKVVILTVKDDAETRERALSLGADDFIPKPFATDKLQDAIILLGSKLAQEKGPANILIVDDEDEIRKQLIDYLSKRYECSFDEAKDGKTAIDKIKTYKYDIILLDIKMPGISGKDVIKEKDKLSQKPRVIVITGYGSSEIAEELIEAGADDYVAKPIKMRVLDSKFANMLASVGKYRVRQR